MPGKLKVNFVRKIPWRERRNDRKEWFISFFMSRTLASDDYNDVRLGGHGTLHGYSNIVNPFLEVSL